MKLRESHEVHYDSSYFDIFFKNVFRLPKYTGFEGVWDENYFTGFNIEDGCIFKHHDNFSECWYNKVIGTTFIANTPYYINEHPYGYLPHGYVNRHWDSRNEWVIEAHYEGWVYLEISVVDSLTSEEDGDEFFKDKDGVIIHANLVIKHLDWGGEDLDNPNHHIELANEALKQLSFFDDVECDESSVCFSGKAFINVQNVKSDEMKFQLLDVFKKINNDIFDEAIKPLLDYLMWQYENI